MEDRVELDAWELSAREQIRDLVARYNANGDTGRFQQVVDLFTPDASMELDGGRVETGAASILTIFTGVRDRSGGVQAPLVLRHLTSTHQIDLVDETHATGRCYYQVLTAVGLDHWGRYIDEYRVSDGRWRFAHRRVTVDGRAAGSLMAPGAPSPTEE